jgi:uncharacterized protein (DUF1800 family)
MALMDEYLVGIDGPWTGEEAAHLWRRAGFGATPAQRASAVGAGDQAAFRAAVDALVNIASDDPWLDGPTTGVPGTYGFPFVDLPDDESDLGLLKEALGLQNLIAHWLYRMRYSTQPLQEQLTQFYHDHFVSEWSKIRPNVTPDVVLGNDGGGPGQPCSGGTLPPDPERADRITSDAMLQQNYLLRRLGFDSFRELVLAVSRDPAMIVYLDNISNRKGRSQENYARELMELFTMGVGNYSEDDVREVAKCLTGETLPNFTCENDWDWSSGFSPALHETGAKFVFGQTVAEDLTGGETEQVIDLIMDKVSVAPDVSGLAAPYNTLPATAVYMSWKLLRWFCNHEVTLSPPAPEVLELADYLRGTDNAAYPARRFPYDMRATLRRLFLSKYFYDASNRWGMYKTPADFVTSALRTLDSADLFSYEFGPGVQMVLMGQILFNPPNVSGWQHGRSWITSTSLTQRFNYGYYLVDVIMQGDDANTRIDNLLAVNGGPIPTSDSFEDIIEYYRDRIVQAELTEEEHTLLLQLLEDMPGANPTQLFRNRVRGLIHVMLSMPITQLK